MKKTTILLLIAICIAFTQIDVYAIDCKPPYCTKVVLKEGIVWYHKIYSNLLGGPQNVNIIDIDNSNPHIIIKPVYKYSSGCEKTSSMGRRTLAIAGINGGFFDAQNGCAPLGLLKIDNKVISYAVSYRPPRSALGIQLDKTILFRRTDSKDPFPEAVHALGGMPNLVKDGYKYVTTTEEGADSIAGVNPRTAICKTPNNHFLMITIDGRATDKRGMSLDDLAQYLLWLGCSDGINLDGGGSTTMWINTEGVVNYPSDGSERYVSNGLFVYYNDNIPPVIEHTPIEKSQKTDILIRANVTDDTGLKAVNLKFKNIGDQDFISRQMINKGNNVYETIIYSDDIRSDLILYYIAAWDGEFRTLLPADAETKNHYFQIEILNVVDAGFDIERDIFSMDTITDDVYMDYQDNDVEIVDTHYDSIAIQDESLGKDIDVLNDISNLDTHILDVEDSRDSYILDELAFDSSQRDDSYIDYNIIYDIEIGLDDSSKDENDFTSINIEETGCSCNLIE